VVVRLRDLGGGEPNDDLTGMLFETPDARSEVDDEDPAGREAADDVGHDDQVESRPVRE
jgi:hypothetical protein